MKEKLAEAVYMSLIGQLVEEAALPWVEEAFTSGSACERAYSDMLDAYGRLRERLGALDEDADAEIIINALLKIQRELEPRKA